MHNTTINIIINSSWSKIMQNIESDESTNIKASSLDSCSAASEFKGNQLQLTASWLKVFKASCSDSISDSLAAFLSS